MKSQGTGRWWFAAFCGVVACIYQLSWAADTSLRYKFEAGKTYTYQVRIEAQTPEYTETITGETIYNVKLADARSGNLTLTHSATLTPQRQYRQQGGSVQAACLQARSDIDRDDIEEPG